MSVATKNAASGQKIFNVPNQLTAARLVLSLVLFVLIAFEYYLAGTIVFVIAASTDWLDGYWARKYGQVTQLGRILDPFVDKIIVCGTFIFLAAVAPGSWPAGSTGVRAWMAVVIVGRELLVTALRSYLESEGADFSASMSGKLKMLVQCLAATISLAALAWHGERPESLAWAVDISIWSAVALTVYSGAAYAQRAISLFRR